MNWKIPACGILESLDKERRRSGKEDPKRDCQTVGKRVDHQKEEETPFFGNAPGPTNLSEYCQAQSEAASSSSGHNNYANFLADQVRLKRPPQAPSRKQCTVEFGPVFNENYQQLLKRQKGHQESQSEEGLEPNDVTRRKQQPGAVTVCAEKYRAANSWLQLCFAYTVLVPARHREEVRK
eukprot:s4531_g6.t1